MKRPVVVLVLVIAIAGVGGLIYLQLPTKQLSDRGGTVTSGMPTIETTVSLGVTSGDHETVDENAFETIRDTAKQLTSQQIQELAEKLTLTLILPKQKFVPGETPVIQAYLRNDSMHTAVLLSASRQSTEAGFPAFTWNVTTTDRHAVEPDDPASAPSPVTVEADQFGYLKPGDVLDLKVENIEWRYGAAMSRPGTYLIQLEYSTDRAHSRNDAECYERFQQDYPDFYARIPAITVGSNIVSVSVSE